MSLKITKSAIDLGIVTRNPEPMVAFYRDVLGLQYTEETAMPGGGSMHRMMCGETMVKIVTPGNLSDVAAPPGGLGGASGYRYWTVSISNLDEAAATCAEAGFKLPVKPLGIRPGVRIAMVEDPDGNWVELLEIS
jgi:catechol 2,3-dioxygenase-like lactoylglutathione lyase family enzyme